MKTLYWSRVPGHFLNKNTGEPYSFAGSNGPKFTGTVREWYETLVETMIDLRNEIKVHGVDDAVIVYVGDDALCILNCSILFKPNTDLNVPVLKRGGTIVDMDIVPKTGLDGLSIEMHTARGAHGKVIITQK